MIKKKRNKDNKLDPLITIITVVKNDKKNILKTIKSVLKQNFNKFEYIIVDGNSSDGTLDILKKNENKIDLLISKKDKNLWEAMNNGIIQSKGDIIGIINSGDTFYKNTLQIVNKYFKQDEKLDFLFGPVKKDRILFRFEPEKINYRFNIYPSHSTGFFIRKRLHKKIGLYNTKMNFGADYDLIFKLLKDKRFKGMVAKKNELFGKFDLNGYSSKIPFYKSYYYESKIRYENGQGILFVTILYFLRILNKFRNILYNR